MEDSQPVQQFRYRAFISYSHRDEAFAVWLHRALETWRVPSRLVGTTTRAGEIPPCLHPVFRDREELSSSPELGSKINEALARSQNLIVICSTASATSHWVNDEVLAYKRLGRGDRVFCLIVDGEPNATDLPGRAAEECFCPALRFTDGQRTEPIAADARPGKDGKGNAKLKLIAGMLGVGFDALKQREQRRQIRRMTAITVAAVTIMAMTIVLSILALVSRHAAVLAQQKAIAAEHTAVVARDDAQRRQTQAQDILGFMLGDLRKKLATVGRLDLMRAVDDKATAYFATLNPRDLTDTALAQQARLFMDIGQVRLAKGELPEAAAGFREALERTRALFARAPQDGNRLFDRAQAEYWVGFAAMQKGDNTTADEMFHKYYASAVKLSAMDSSDFAWQKEVAYGLQAVSVMEKKMGRTADAERGMQEQLAMYHVWLKQHPGDLQLRDEAGNVVSWLGSLALEQGQLARAESYFSENVQDLEQNMAAEPANAVWKDKSVDALAWLADVQEQRGELGPAHASAASSAALAADLYARDPENNDWRFALALCRVRQSRLDAANEPRKANEEAEFAESLLLAAHAKDPKSLSVTEDVAHSQNQLARLALSHGDADKATKDITSSLSMLEPAWRGKQDEDLRVEFAQTLLLQGEIAQRKRQADEAKEAWTKARELLIADSQPEIPFARLDLLVRVLQRLGHGAEAAPYLHRLAAAGYVPLYPWPDAPGILAATPAQKAGGITTRQ
ncbi:MAG: TIR domain-containing protein [Proteobacteria bacterium]|nr:TIR domain-containing protein [Pseudomonadota bacterium]